MFNKTALTTKAITSTGYTLSGTIGTINLTNFYTSNGTLLKQEQSLKSGSTTVTIQDLFNTDGSYIENTFTNNVQTLSSHISRQGYVLDKTIYSNGKVTEVDTYLYDAQHQIIGTAIQKDGKLTSPITFDPNWSVKDGYGTIDALSALNKLTNSHLADAVKSTNNALSTSNLDDLIKLGFTGKGITIANIDTGIDLKNKALSHVDLTKSFNFVNNTVNVQDDNGHGTLTASTMISAQSGTIQGGSPDANLLVLKALDKSGNTSDLTLSNAINYAVDNGANVINLSVGGSTALPLVEKALQYADTHNVVCVISSGNYGNEFSTYPAVYAQKFQNVIAVGATQLTNGNLIDATYSDNAGSHKAYNFITALGTVAGFNQNGVAVTGIGTSYASPIVASAVADLLQVNHNAHDVVLSLVGTAHQIDPVFMV